MEQRRIVLTVLEDKQANSVVFAESNPCIGYAGEHLATILGFNLPENWLNQSAKYQICFRTSDGRCYSTDLLDIAELALPSGIMIAGTMYVQVLATDSDGTVIKKTEVCKCTVGKSIADGEVIANYDGVKLVSQLTEELQAVVDAAAEAKESLMAAIAEGNIADLQAFVGYTADDILGLQVDYQNKTFTRLAGASGLTPGKDFDRFEMFGGRKRCNVLDDGTITAYYGDENYTENGSNGQVMVYQPAFYYKVVPLKLDKNTDSGIGYHIRKANYYVSATPHTGFKLHPAFYDEGGNPVDYILYSAYEGSLYSNGHIVSDDSETEATWDLSTDYLCSYASTKPISGLYKPLTKTNAETLAKNLGTGWHIDTIKSVSANQLLMMIELGTMNTQAAIGMGVVSITDNSAYNCSSLTGSTANLGNSTGMAASTVNKQGSTTATYTENGKVAVTYRGVENPWGNICKHVNSINILGDGTTIGYSVYVANGESYKMTGITMPFGKGYINSVGYGNSNYDWLIVPSKIGGNNALPVGDYTNCPNSYNGNREIRYGGFWNNNFWAGAFCVESQIVNSKSRAVGTRLLYVPTARI